MNSANTADFTDNPAVSGREDQYETMTVNVAAVMESWRMSLFSYEWVTPDGAFKPVADLPPAQQDMRRVVEAMLRDRQKLDRPILGIGLMDNIEIGSGRAVFLTLAALGHARVSVHVPKTNIKEFAPFKAA